MTVNDEMAEIIGEFLAESYENLDSLEQAFVLLEQEADADTLAQIFRTVHTIKGTAGFLGFGALEGVSHVGENLLSKLRDGLLEMDTEIASVLLQMTDAIREILGEIEQTGAESGKQYPELIAELVRLDAGEPAVEEPIAPVVPIPRSAEAEVYEESPERFGDQLLRAGVIEPTQLDDALAAQVAGDPRHVGELLVASAAIEPDDVVGALKSQAERSERPAPPETIRVDVGLLDELMNSVGELVLARNQILQFSSSESDAAFVATSQRLNLITSELQENVMQTRMQPIEVVWSKFPRVVRDLTVTCGKQARLEMEGRQTELDKTLLEAIRDPLTHLIRNSVDHGLETVERRLEAGKPAEGVVTLAARHEGGQVVVQISDDGAGIDPAVIRRKAVEKGLLSADEAAARSDREIINLIFEAGFSTAAAVTNISGRGVGMDVVRTNIEGIGGSVDVRSTVGVGTTFTVKIPLTLAIIPALVVTAGGERYAVPQANLSELVRLERSSIEYLGSQPVFRLRGRLVPLFQVSDVFDANGTEQPDLPTSLNVVVVRADGRTLGLGVDDISDTAEIVVKPLGRYLQHATAFAGATIMGDGLVALILDVAGFAEHVGLRREGNESATQQQVEDTARVEVVGQRLLVVSSGERRFALPLDTVARLEQIPSASLEYANGRPAIQHGSGIMPLVVLAHELGIASNPFPTVIPAIVFSSGDRSAGLLVDEIIDIVQETIEISTDAGHGVVGSAVVAGAITDILDVDAVLHAVLPAARSYEGAVA